MRSNSWIQIARWRVAVVDDPHATVVGDTERGVDAVELQPDRIGPRAGGILRGDEEVAAAVDHRAEDVERAVVIVDRGRKEAARDAEVVELELRRPIDDMAELRPVHEIAAMENREAGKIGESGIDEIVVVASAALPRNAADAWVGIEAGEDGIAERARGQRPGEGSVAAGVFEPVEGDGGGRECAAKKAKHQTKSF